MGELNKKDTSSANPPADFNNYYLKKRYESSTKGSIEDDIFLGRVGLLTESSKIDSPSFMYSMRAIKNLLYTRTTSSTIGEEERPMDWQEKYIDKLDRDLGDIKASLRTTEERVFEIVNQSMAEAREARTELRDRDNQRHLEFLSIKNEFSELRTEISESKRWNLGTFISVAVLCYLSI